MGKIFWAGMVILGIVGSTPVGFLLGGSAFTTLSNLKKQSLPTYASKAYSLKTEKKTFGIFSKQVTTKFRNVFSLPYARTVGVLDATKEFSFLTFNPDLSLKKIKLVKDIVLLDAVKGTVESDIYFALVAGKRLAYSQSGRLTVVDLTTRKTKRFRATDNQKQHITKIRSAGPLQSKLVVEIGHLDNSDEITSTNLQVVDLAGAKYAKLASTPIKYESLWGMHQNKIHVVHTSGLQVYDQSLNLVQSPLTSQFRQITARLHKISELAIHPQLPLAFFVDFFEDGKEGQRATLWFLSWVGDKVLMKPVLVSNDVSHVSISPNGEWLIFSKEFSEGDNKVVLVEINAKLADYLGNISLLGSSEYLESLVWINSPISLVMAEPDRLVVWDISKAHRTK